MGVTPPYWLIAGVEHHLPLIRYWDMSLPLFSMLTAPVTEAEGNDPANRRVHSNAEPGLLYLLPPQLPIASTSASSGASVVGKRPTLLCHSTAESAPPPLDPYRYLSGGSDYPYPTALEA